MADLDDDLERELAIGMRNGATIADPLAAKIAENRSAIESATREIMAIERERDLQVRESESRLEQAEFVYSNAVAHFTREIGKAKASAASKVNVQRQLLRSAEAALKALEPFDPPKDEDAPKRRVPRMVAGE